MRTRTKIITGIIAMILSCVLLFTVMVVNNNTNQVVGAATRTVELSYSPEYEAYLKDFNETTLEHDDNNVSFYGVMDYNEQVVALFDQIALVEDEDTEQYNIKYDCSFSLEAMQFTFKVLLVDQNNDIVDVDETVTDAFVTETGSLDAYIEIDGVTYLLSDYIDTNAIDNCLFGWLKALIKVVVVVYLIIAETAEQIKARQNYEYNKNLEKNNNGVNSKTYITDQSDSSTKGHKPANYRFGFTTFGGVGCEVAAAYNAMIGLDKAERLSETIYCFEKWAIEFASGWGHLGSDPYEIGRYFRKKGVNYKQYLSMSALNKGADDNESCHIVMSRWNKPITDGLHTFYVKKQSKESFDSYDWSYSTNKVNRTSLNDFNDGSAFIVGYIVW